MKQVRTFGAQGRLIMFGCVYLAAGCTSEDTIMDPRDDRFAGPASVLAPADLVTIEHAGQSLEFWP
ncbi:MAG TPA: hypothetical protein VFP10_05385, partial [Candidatus Eisenbacteria bacterium]|nr:hypothetical protein [Candidatus Eisenbacteria bacterium]